jgi:hypothetical protein
MFLYIVDRVWKLILAGLALCEGNIPEKHHANRNHPNLSLKFPFKTLYFLGLGELTASSYVVCAIHTYIHTYIHMYVRSFIHGTHTRTQTGECCLFRVTFLKKNSHQSNTNFIFKMGISWRLGVWQPHLVQCMTTLLVDIWTDRLYMYHIYSMNMYMYCMYTFLYFFICRVVDLPVFCISFSSMLN